MKLLCQVYKSPRRPESYLYVNREDGLSRVPAALLEQFGEPKKVMLLALDSRRKLARADIELVLEKLDSDGFYLQMPPGPEDLLRRHQGERDE